MLNHALIRNHRKSSPGLLYHRAMVSQATANGRSEAITGAQPAQCQLITISAVTNARFAPLHGLPVGPIPLSTTPVPLRNSYVRHERHSFGATAYAAASVCGSAAALRSGLIPLCAPFQPPLHFPRADHRPKPKSNRYALARNPTWNADLNPLVPHDDINRRVASQRVALTSADDQSWADSHQAALNVPARNCEPQSHPR